MMFAVVLSIVPCVSEAVKAETIRIVALGASNTNSYGLSPSEGWPAKLEGMLRAKGFDVRVVVSANNGDGTAAILGRVDSVVTSGTRAVVYDSGERNDIRRGVPAGVARANAAQIAARIRARGAVPIAANSLSLPPHLLQEDKSRGPHANPRGHSQVASRLLPQVVAAIGKKK
jgi:acyl-CoA thioesterase-1